ncbi:hypothetical protein IBX65_07265 [Candidatus Aerophobetes bacterium]|nr:hypothetical protein [Candidatus Aerophobetes bacterium]
MEEKRKYCGEFAKLGVCRECGTVYAAEIFCGKEWCNVCREKMESRRFGRLYPKVYRMNGGFGFFVFTIPEHMRPYFLEKGNLSKLRTFLRRKLKRIYLDLRAIARWHFFDTEENLYKYHPHLNIMVDALEYINPNDLCRLKQDYKRFLERETGQKIATKTNPQGKVDVFYRFYSVKRIKEEFEKLQSGKKKQSKFLKDKYIKEIRKSLQVGWSLDDACNEQYLKIRAHKLKYITRATFLIYQKQIGEKLKGFRNCSIWGKFEKLKLEEKEKIDSEIKKEFKGDVRGLIVSRGQCPFCRGRIKWAKGKGRSGLVDSGICRGGEDLGGGIWVVAFGSRDSPVREKLIINEKEVVEDKRYHSLLYESAMNDNKWKERVDIYG